MTTCCSSVRSPISVASAGLQISAYRERRGKGSTHNSIASAIAVSARIRPVLALAATTEGQHLVHHVLRSLAGLHHLPDIAPRGRILSQRRLRHFAVTKDGAKDVVEFVSDAAGQRSDGFQPLRLVQAGLQRLALGFRRARALGHWRTFGGCAQERDVVLPPLPRLHRWRVKMPCRSPVIPHRDAEPGSNPCARSAAFSRLSGICPTSGTKISPLRW